MANEIGGFPDILVPEERRNQILMGGRLAQGCIVYQRASGSATVVDYEGFLDKNTVTTFHEFLSALLQEDKTLVVVNFEKLDYVSSAGIHLLSGAVKRFRKAGGDFRVYAVSKKVRQVIELIGLDTLLMMYEDEQKAVEAVSPS